MTVSNVSRADLLYLLAATKPENHIEAASHCGYENAPPSLPPQRKEADMTPEVKKALDLALTALNSFPNRHLTPFIVDARKYVSKVFEQASAAQQRQFESTTDMMMALADRLGELPDDVDPRAWEHLLAYAPNSASVTERYRVIGPAGNEYWINDKPMSNCKILEVQPLCPCTPPPSNPVKGNPMSANKPNKPNKFKVNDRVCWCELPAREGVVTEDAHPFYLVHWDKHEAALPTQFIHFNYLRRVGADVDSPAPTFDFDKLHAISRTCGARLASGSPEGYLVFSPAALRDLLHVCGLNIPPAHPSYEALSERLPTGWQPIETAPPLGTICVGREFSEGRWSFNHAWFNPETAEWTDAFSDIVLSPTHWMPLPNAAYGLNILPAQPQGESNPHVAEIQELKRQLENYKAAFQEFHYKTEWVQYSALPGELGMHRADILRKRIDLLTKQNAALAEKLSSLQRPDNGH